MSNYYTTTSKHTDIVLSDSTFNHIHSKLYASVEVNKYVFIYDTEFNNNTNKMDRYSMVHLSISEIDAIYNAIHGVK